MSNRIFALCLALLVFSTAGLVSQESDEGAPLPTAGFAPRESDRDALLSGALSDITLIKRYLPPFHFRAWGKAIWAPVVYKGDADGEVDGVAGEGPGTGVGSGPGWDNIGAAVGFETWGSNREETGGFELKLRAKSGGGDIYANDNTAFLWARFFDMIRMQLGMYRYDEFRGKIGGISEITGGYGGDEDTIFQRVESDSFGALFIITPPPQAPVWLHGLRVFSSFGVSGKLDAESGEFAALTPKGMAYVFATPHLGIGYKHDRLGFARLQFIGSNYKWGHGEDWYHGGTFWFPSHVRESARLEAALNITAVPNLSLDIGAGIPWAVTVVKDDYGNIKSLGPTYRELGSRDKGARGDIRLANAEGDVYQPPVLIAAGADYTLGSLGLRGRLKLGFGERLSFDLGGDDFTGGFDLEAGIEPSWKFNFGTLAADVAVRINSNDEFSVNENISHNGTFDLGLGLWYTKNLGSGIVFKIGASANLPLGGDAYFWTPNGTRDQKEERTAYRNSKLLIVVPLLLTVDIL